MYLITSNFDGSVVYRSPSFEEIQAVYSPAVHSLFAISPGCEVYTFGDGAINDLGNSINDLGS